jgi:hypothetical protein
MILVGLAAVGAIIMMNLNTILPFVGQLQSQITPALPVATAPAIGTRTDAPNHHHHDYTDASRG